MSGGWRVSVHNDDVNTVVTVRHLLGAFCGGDAVWTAHATLAVHQRGATDVAEFPDEASAEALVVALQRQDSLALDPTLNT
ncbi:ATP-dependent Clp protease adaptor ClpS [Saccharothrix deserti]|uniref:ATP-dependent Clp protease adaptor ClpS n=1 Tax=Saccharothrix deserti TaxID=2593674 RepID=UPI00131D4FCE|nr:ATP-dependent Clp protease adaptor ClpS [Saccharothrix deserti]